VSACNTLPKGFGHGCSTRPSNAFWPTNPGRRFIQQMLERGWVRSARRVAELKARGQISPSVDPDILRMSFVSLAMTPMLLKNIFEEQTDRPMDAAFLENLARFNGRLFAAGLALAAHE